MYAPHEIRSVQPVRGLRGAVDLSGDKSISHRYAILGAIAGSAAVAVSSPGFFDVLERVCAR